MFLLINFLLLYFSVWPLEVSKKTVVKCEARKQVSQSVQVRLGRGVSVRAGSTKENIKSPSKLR